MFVCKISLMELGSCHLSCSFLLYIYMHTVKETKMLLNLPSLLPSFVYFFIIVCDRDYPCHLWGPEAFPHQEEYRTYQQHLRPTTSTPRSRQIRWNPVYVESDVDDTVLRLKNFNSSVETKVKKIVNYVQKG